MASTSSHSHAAAQGRGWGARGCGAGSLGPLSDKLAHIYLHAVSEAMMQQDNPTSPQTYTFCRNTFPEGLVNLAICRHVPVTPTGYQGALCAHKAEKGHRNCSGNFSA